MTHDPNDTIVAVSTARGSGAIALIRLSGPRSVDIVSGYFHCRTGSLQNIPPRTAVFGTLSHNDIVLDEVLVTVFRQPHSYSGQDMVEVACHGSVFIQQKLMQLFLAAGARPAEPGEFTLRAFLNGKLDLSQAEAVADLVASNSAVSHQVAMQQMRGGYSDKIRKLRENLLSFASLIELELDFSEEDVEFANRNELKILVSRILQVIRQLVESFELGNVIRNGVPVAIVGRPNAGKSTLLNVLLEDDKAIVSDIPGTTRDLLEDVITIEGVQFRFIDTAGLRTTSDVIEQIGMSRAYQAMKRSAIIIYLFDAHEMTASMLRQELSALAESAGDGEVIPVANKIDRENSEAVHDEFRDFKGLLFISAREHQNIDSLMARLLEIFDRRSSTMGDTVVTNARHATALRHAEEALEKVAQGLATGVPPDFLALDIRYALDELGHITGEVTSEDLLSNIFTKFCIGK